MRNGKRYKRKKKIYELPLEERKFMRNMIRTFCKENSFYHFGSKDGYPPEKMEDMIEGLIDLGVLNVFVSKDKQNFTII